MQTTKNIGDAGERLAQEHLEKLGYKILAKNWKYSRIGEIDIIAQDKNTIIFVEVKFRRSKTFGSAIESITPKKLEKIYQSALFYLQKNSLECKNYRIDVIAIDKTENGYKTEHFKNISL